MPGLQARSLRRPKSGRVSVLARTAPQGRHRRRTCATAQGRKKQDREPRDALSRRPRQRDGKIADAQASRASGSTRLRVVPDHLTPEARSQLMARVKTRNTAPELALRRALWAAGLRGWRVHPK